MGKKYSEIDDKIKAFIQAQKLFFVGTAAPDGRVSVSPKGIDTFRIIDKNRIAWLNLSGSGNETAAHLLENSRMTIMFCAFEGSPNILRLYGKARVYHPRDPEWQDLMPLFPALPGARQIIDMQLELLQNSCGMAVPYFDYQGERNELLKWAEDLGDAGIQKYWEDKNQLSLDGKATKILG